MACPNVLLVGIPGSGKSTVCAQLVTQGYVVVSTDAARAVIGGDPSVQHPWPQVWAVCVDMAVKALAAGHPIAYDATNILPKHRKAALGLDPSGAWEAWVLTTSLDEALRRNAARDRVVPEHVIRSMNERLVPPSLEEGFVVIRHLS